jgi:UDP-GlcNAc:undecaprenyl-phosphate/decaprenyl-phosphate GlcNAc-1-phosphate transferase
MSAATMQTLLGFMLAMSLTMVLIPVLMRWAAPLRIMDVPGERKVHESPVPRVGGIAMVSGVLLAWMIRGAPNRPMQALVVCAAILLAFGVWDDRRALSAGPKFAGQAIAALFAILWGAIQIHSLTLDERVPLPAWLSLPLTFFFLVGGTNAFNLADGLDGLAGGMSMLCLCGTALLAFTEHDAMVGTAAVAIIGALIGFLRFNTYPARVFMGDGGSQVLGFAATALVVLLTQDPRSAVSTALPLLLLGVPIIDTLMVMIERLIAGQSPFRADRRHIHHRLLAIGFTHREAVCTLYLLQGGLFTTAWFLRYSPDVTVVLVFLTCASLIVLSLRVAQHSSWRLRRVDAKAVTVQGSGRLPLWPREITLQSGAGLVLGATLTVFAVRVLLWGAQPTGDVRLLALTLALLLCVSLLVRWRSSDAGWADKVALYSGAALAIFLSKRAFPGPMHLGLGECVNFGVLAVAMVVCIRSLGERTFSVTPLDLLVLLLVVTVPNLPDSVASVRSLGLAVAELVLLFYAIETLSIAARSRWRWLSAAGAVFLFGLAMRPGL